jgi:hypothetical protein
MGRVWTLGTQFGQQHVYSRWRKHWQLEEEEIGVDRNSQCRSPGQEIETLVDCFFGF